MASYNFKLKIAIATSFLQNFYENTLIFFYYCLLSGRILANPQKLMNLVSFE